MESQAQSQSESKSGLRTAIKVWVDGILRHREHWEGGHLQQGLSVNQRTALDMLRPITAFLQDESKISGLCKPASDAKQTVATQMRPDRMWTTVGVALLDDLEWLHRYADYLLRSDQPSTKWVRCHFLRE